jgi:hypothetical protein
LPAARSPLFFRVRTTTCRSGLLRRSSGPSHPEKGRTRQRVTQASRPRRGHGSLQPRSDR